MLKPPERGFFVGYFKKVPADIRRLMLVFIVTFVGAFSAAAFVVALDTDSPGSGSFAGPPPEGELTGTIDLLPYPVLRVAASAGKPARAVMLAGTGKFGVSDRAEKLEGQSVVVGGFLARRGDLEMLLVGDRMEAEDEQPADLPVPTTAQDLGRWRLTGEICDGKCAAGAMRPGTGLAHKACANLCISGGVPPVFVSTAPVEGHNFLLMASADGGPIPKWLLDRTAVPVVLEGRVERRDDLLVFKVDREAKGGGT
ncbi:hypothetical protein [uncultured Roseibium sp.]|uniref:hypothetical protein n=1 Tax=uncultured Roseibium sp. TaxID=1936171 RepID=UPI003217B18F